MLYNYEIKGKEHPRRVEALGASSSSNKSPAPCGCVLHRPHPWSRPWRLQPAGAASNATPAGAATCRPASRASATDGRK